MPEIIAKRPADRGEQIRKKQIKKAVSILSDTFGEK